MGSLGTVVANGYQPSPTAYVPEGEGEVDGLSECHVAVPQAAVAATDHDDQLQITIIVDPTQFARPDPPPVAPEDAQGDMASFDVSPNKPPTRPPSPPAVPKMCVPAVGPATSLPMITSPGHLGGLSPELPRSGRVPDRVPGDDFDGLGRLTEPCAHTADPPITEAESVFATAAQPEPLTPILGPVAVYDALAPAAAEPHNKLMQMPPLSSKPRKSWSRFTPQDKERLLDLKEKKNRTWSEIAVVFPGRTIPSLQSLYYQMIKCPAPQSTENLPAQHASRSPAKKSRPWSTEEDAHIRNCVAQGGSKIWVKICSGLLGRSKQSCKSRYHNILSKRSGQITVSPVQALVGDSQQSNPLTTDLNATRVAFKLVVDNERANSSLSAERIDQLRQLYRGWRESVFGRHNAAVPAVLPEEWAVVGLPPTKFYRTARNQGN